MTLELKQFKNNLFHNSTEPYKLGGVKEISSDTVYGIGHFAITIADTRVFILSAFEYVKNADTGELYVLNGEWVGNSK